MKCISLSANSSPAQSNEKEIFRAKLINKLNYINFRDGYIQVNFRHNKYDRAISLDATPLPCLDDRLECVWARPGEIHDKLQSYTFENFFVIDGQTLIVVEPDVLDISQSGAVFSLPKTCMQVSCRKFVRSQCKEVNVQFVQNGAMFLGSLVDSSAVSFRVELYTNPPQTFQWINPEFPVHLIFSTGKDIIFSGECRIIKQKFGQVTRSFVLEPIAQQIQRFKPKEYRSTRQELAPLPNIRFKYPLSGKMIDLKVIDLSGSGFAVEEDEELSVLFPGLIIPEIELRFANSFSVRCKTQVVYRQVIKDAGRSAWVKCGLAFLDMAIQDHVRLLSLHYQAKDRNSYLCNTVNMDDLWQFFFETGFIYPRKYTFIQSNKNKFRETYEKLYVKSPNIARHFIYQEKGVILGHMAMLRFYENSWLIHHHAASKTESNRAGLVVLNQIGRFINDSHRLYSIHMNFVLCYFRPENRFPDRIFGGMARSLNNPKGCSLDSFAYFHFDKPESNSIQLESPWQIRKTGREDLLELESFYEHSAGGLMIDALDLEPGMLYGGELAREFSSVGLKRERFLYSLKKDGHLRAVIMVNCSDEGLNMSEITNSIKIIVVDQEDLGWQQLRTAIVSLTLDSGHQEIPVLLYPVSYAEAQQVPFEKTYNLWILNMQYTDQYFSFLSKLLKTAQH